MKKTFDTLAWIRKVRDDNYRRGRGLSPEQVLDGTRAKAEVFRSYRAKRRVRQQNSSGPG